MSTFVIRWRDRRGPHEELVHGTERAARSTGEAFRTLARKAREQRVRDIHVVELVTTEREVE